ncbi:MAG: DNA-binding protein [Eubacterium sp.]|nr:DNA-binding protein [Eubacterium sp.]
MPISIEYFKQFAKKNLVNTAEACEILECSRQNIDSLVKREKIEIVHASSKNKMFFKADIHKKLW